jgi:hypothetical protein
MICARQEFQSFFSSVPPAQKEKEKEKGKNALHRILLYLVRRLSLHEKPACMHGYRAVTSTRGEKKN